MNPLTCYRCKREIADGDHFGPWRIQMGVGRTIKLPGPYHAKCVPPALFHKQALLKAEWDARDAELAGYLQHFRLTVDLSGTNRDDGPGIRSTAQEGSPETARLPSGPGDA